MFIPASVQKVDDCTCGGYYAPLYQDVKKSGTTTWYRCMHCGTFILVTSNLPTSQAVRVAVIGDHLPLGVVGDSGDCKDGKE